MSAKEKAEFNREHTIWRVPKPFDLGLLFGTAPERGMDWALEKDPKALRDFFRSASSTMPNPIPTAAVPLIENMANWSIFRGRRIIPRGKEDVAPEKQYTQGTSEIAKKAGGIVGYSPAKIENLVRGWFGGMGQLGLDIGSQPLKRRDISEPEKSLADVPGVRGFVARFPGQPESIERFYEKYQEAQEKKATFDLLRREGKITEVGEYLKKNREALYEARQLQGTADQLSQLRKLMDRIREAKDLSPEAKRLRLDEFTFRMAKLADASLKRAVPQRRSAPPEFQFAPGP
jgi:hypothetical protein